MQLVDVEQIAENTPAEVVDGWDAFYRCEPFGQEREMQGWLMWMMNNIFAATIHDKKTLEPLSSFMPGEWIHQPQKQAKTMEDVEKIVAAKWGTP